MDVRCKQRAVIEFLYHEGIKEAEIVERLRKVYKDLAPSDYHLFGPMKLHMKGMRHENDDDLKTTVTK